VLLQKKYLRASVFICGLTSFFWQFDLRFFMVAAKQHRHMTDALDEFGLAVGDDIAEYLFFLIAVTYTELDLDQLMRIQRQVDFIHDILTQAMLTDHHDRF